MEVEDWECVDGVIRAVLCDGSTGPVIGRKTDQEQVLIDVEMFGGLWAGDLIHARLPVGGTDLPSEISEQFKTLGIAEWKNAIDSELILAARKEVNEAHLNGILKRSNHGQSTNTRTDSVGFFNFSKKCFEESDSEESEFDVEETVDANIVEAFRQMELIGASFQKLVPMKMLCPPQGMIAMYPGNESKYVQHYDNEKDDSGHWRNFRCLTIVLYLNDPIWNASKNGGVLRCKALNGMNLEILPSGGSIVVFDSMKISHEVVASKSNRAALSMWFVTPDILNTDASPQGNIEDTVRLPKKKKRNPIDVVSVPKVIVGNIEESNESFGFNFFS